VQTCTNADDARSCERVCYIRTFRTAEFPIKKSKTDSRICSIHEILLSLVQKPTAYKNFSNTHLSLSE